MAFKETSAPHVTEALPFPFTATGAEAGGAFPADDRYDVTFGDMGFLLRPSAQHPYLRASESPSKQRIDTSAEAGEQSLGSWWVRSQTSWHMGAGIDWYEPGSDEQSVHRFGTSHNVDVWTEGELRLLPKMVPASTQTAPTYLSTVVDGAAFSICYASDDTITTAAGGAASLTTGAATQPAVAGSVVYVGHEAAVSVVPLSTGTPAVIRDTTGVARCWWVKSRLLVAVGPAVYWVDPTTASGTLPVASVDQLLFTHPDADWTWTDMAPTGDSILLAGHSASRGAVYSMTVTDVEGVPEFTTPAEVAELPPGELVTCMGTYLGAYVVLGTSKGVRVGEVGEGGRIAYGQLTVETLEPVVDVTFTDRFAYLPVSRNLADDTSGVVRIDLSAPVEGTTAFAWAWDVSTTDEATMSSVAFTGTLAEPKVLMASDEHLYFPSADPADTGWLDGGTIRYATTEPKNFRYIRVDGELNDGEVAVERVREDGSDRIVTYGALTGIDGEAAINLPGQRPMGDMQFRITLTPSSGGDSPVVTGFAVKALPAPRRARLYRFPLSCFDFEVDAMGTALGGYESSALHRLQEFEEAENTGRPIRVVDHRTGEALVGVIEGVEFTGVMPVDRSDPNFGGVVDVTVRKL